MNVYWVWDQDGRIAYNLLQWHGIGIFEYGEELNGKRYKVVSVDLLMYTQHPPIHVSIFYEMVPEENQEELEEARKKAEDIIDHIERRLHIDRPPHGNV